MQNTILSFVGKSPAQIKKKLVKHCMKHQLFWKVINLDEDDDESDTQGMEDLIDEIDVIEAR